MKLRHQALLAVVPLFLMIGLAGAGASLLLKSHEWRKAAEQQARGMAASLAEYLTGDQWPTSSRQAEHRLVQAESRLSRWALLHEIRVWDSEGELIHRWPVPATSGESTAALLPFLDSARATEKNAFAVGRLETATAGDSLLHGGAVVRDASGGRLGWVECELDAAAWKVERQRQGWGTLELFGGILVLGIGLSLLFCRIVMADIRTLIRAAEQVGGGNYESPRGLHVKEFQDLSETFSVVDSLTGENRRKFQRSLIENEIFRTSDVLVDEFQSAVMPGIDEKVGGRRVVSRLLDKSDGSRWHGVGASGNRGWYWFGSVGGAAGIDKATRALAAQTELEAMLLRQGVLPGPALAELAPLYDLEMGCVLLWDGPAAMMECWTWERGADHASRTEISTTSRHLIHDLKGDLATTIELVWAGSESRAVEMALADLTSFLGETNAVVGTVLTDSEPGD